MYTIKRNVRKYKDTRKQKNELLKKKLSTVGMIFGIRCTLIVLRIE